MEYKTNIIEAYGWLTRKTFTDKNIGELYKLKKEAHNRAVQCLPFNKYPTDIKHLVYYYELKKDKNTVEVEIYMNPRGVDDKMFYDFVETFEPEYVGAIHRHS